MTKRTRYIWLTIFAVIGGFLAIGAWHQSPGQDPDNQGGYVIVLLFFLILLFIYVPATMRSIGARLRGDSPETVRPANLQQLIQHISYTIQATEAVAFAVKRDFFDEGFKTLVHERKDDASPETRASAVLAFKEIVRPCILQGKDGAIEIAETESAEGKQFCLVTLARQKDVVVGAAAFIVRCLDLHEAKIVLMHIEREASGLSSKFNL